MTDDETTVEIPEELLKKVNDRREPGENLDETLERLLRDTLDRSPPLRSAFTLITLVVAFGWLLTFTLVDETLSSVIGGIYLATVLSWQVWQHIVTD